MAILSRVGQMYKEFVITKSNDNEFIIKNCNNNEFVIKNCINIFSVWTDTHHFGVTDAYIHLHFRPSLSEINGIACHYMPFYAQWIKMLSQ